MLRITPGDNTNQSTNGSSVKGITRLPAQIDVLHLTKVALTDAQRRTSRTPTDDKAYETRGRQR